MMWSEDFDVQHEHERVSWKCVVGDPGTGAVDLVNHGAPAGI